MTRATSTELLAAAIEQHPDFPPTTLNAYLWLTAEVRQSQLENQAAGGPTGPADFREMALSDARFALSRDLSQLANDAATEWSRFARTLRAFFYGLISN